MKKLLITSNSHISRKFLRKNFLHSIDSEISEQIYSLNTSEDFFVFLVNDSSDINNYLGRILKEFSVDLVLSMDYALSLIPNIESLKVLKINEFSILPPTMVFWDKSNILNFEYGIQNSEEIIGSVEDGKNTILASHVKKVSNWKVKDWLNQKLHISLLDRYGSDVAGICNEFNVDLILCRAILVKRSKFNVITNIIDWSAHYSYFDLLKNPHWILPYMVLHYRKNLLANKFNQYFENFITYKS